MSFTSLDWLQRSGPDDAPSVYGPTTLRAYRPAGWTMPARDAREPWERVTPEEIDAWVAQDAERVMLKRKVAASLAWLKRDFGGKRG